MGLYILEQHWDRDCLLLNFRLDYCGISFLIVGSFVPWLYYSFYCRVQVKLTYLVIVCTLGAVCIFVSMWDGFAEPRFRTLRAGRVLAVRQNVTGSINMLP